MSRADQAVLLAKVLAALEQAAREEHGGVFGRNRFWVCDRSSTGALVLRISHIAGLSGAVVRRHLRYIGLVQDNSPHRFDVNYMRVTPQRIK